MLRPEEIESLSRTVTNKDEAEQVLSNFLPLVRGFPVKEFRSSHQMEHLPSKYILPDDWSEFSPVCSTGNGNCLFNSVSIVLKGDETLAPLLRLLATAELVAHAQFYATYPQFPEMVGDDTYTTQNLMPVLLSEDAAVDIYQGQLNDLPAAITYIARITSKPKVYAGCFHFMALATVVDQPISSVYPSMKSSIRVRNAVHRVFYPRGRHGDGSCDEAVRINVMWSTSSRNQDIIWKPNHFVPLLKKPVSRSSMDSPPLMPSFADIVKCGNPNREKVKPPLDPIQLPQSPSGSCSHKVPPMESPITVNKTSLSSTRSPPKQPPSKRRKHFEAFPEKHLLETGSHKLPPMKSPITVNKACLSQTSSPPKQPPSKKGKYFGASPGKCDKKCNNSKTLFLSEGNVDRRNTYSSGLGAQFDNGRPNLSAFGSSTLSPLELITPVDSHGATNRSLKNHSLKGIAKEIQ